MEENQGILSSSASTQKSLEAIRRGDAGLNERRTSIMARVPNVNDWAALKGNSITIKDLAYLSASTGHEFALLRGKTKDIVFHGTERHCEFTSNIFDDFMEGGNNYVDR